jgi:hypothetical protein
VKSRPGRAAVWALAAAFAVRGSTPAGADQSVADFKAAADAALPAAGPARPPASFPGAFASAHGRMQPVPGGFSCQFAEAPLAEAAVDLARAWGVAVAYFGPPGQLANAVFTAPTVGAALLRLADRTALTVTKRGDAWCLEEAPAAADLPRIHAFPPEDLGRR